MARSALFYIVLAVVALSFAPKVAAFGAGNIPSFSYVEDKAFRHGDIEDIIGTLAKAAGGGFFGRSVKFTPLDVKRVYFGNWLRDYSQAVDTGALEKAPLQTILNVVMVLGFLAHGYATGEFEVTKDRLGCYLPTEHIDNPKGYADGKDARRLDSRLRPPVDPRELEIDPQTGMKNYIANERGNWDTSTALVRRTFVKCIEAGRRFRQTDSKDDSYEAMRLLGQGLHTLEDFTAHSNFCELSLISMGHQNVFPHVGRNTKIRAPNGKDVYPLVTGSFGGADFIHSLMGEAQDHISQTSVSDLTKEFSNARSVQEGQGAAANNLRSMFFNIPGSNSDDLSREMDSIQNIRATSNQDPSTMSPQELHAVLWRVLSFRDNVMKRIENIMDRIPGLSSLTEKIGNSVSVFVLTTIEPFVKPMLGTATDALHTSSAAVIDSHDQYEVWTDWNSSDPTHSFLSKDHFNLILNEPAGQIAKIIVQFAVERIVGAWDNNNVNPNQVADEVLQCLFHPDFHNRNSQIQVLMLEHMRKWFDSTGKDKNEILNRLTADNVKAGKNRRIGDKSESTGHVHNAMLPEGGLQQVLAQHNVHVPGANILNAGQDLLSGKKPWNQNFGSGGTNAWRGGVDGPSGGAPTQSYTQPQQSYTQPAQQSWNQPSHPPPQQQWGGQQGQQRQQHGQQRQGGGGGWNSPPRQASGGRSPPGGRNSPPRRHSPSRSPQPWAGQQQQQQSWNQPSHPPPGQQGGWGQPQQHQQPHQQPSWDQTPGAGRHHQQQQGGWGQQQGQGQGGWGNQNRW